MILCCLFQPHREFFKEFLIQIIWLIRHHWTFQLRQNKLLPSSAGLFSYSAKVYVYCVYSAVLNILYIEMNSLIFILISPIITDLQQYFKINKTVIIIINTVAYG